MDIYNRLQQEENSIPPAILDFRWILKCCERYRKLPLHDEFFVVDTHCVYNNITDQIDEYPCITYVSGSYDNYVSVFLGMTTYEAINELKQSHRIYMRL